MFPGGGRRVAECRHIVRTTLKVPVAVADQEDYVAFEYKATESWKRRDYSAAIEAASEGKEMALRQGDVEGAARLLVLRATCEADVADYVAAVESVDELWTLPAGTEPLTLIQGQKLKIVALQGLGRMEDAVALGRQTIDMAPKTLKGQLASIDLHWALIAALAESGYSAEAWDMSMELATLAEGVADAQAAGKSYWTIGNVGFMTGRSEEAVHYHELAAAKLSSQRDVNGWALFNKASAHMRLMAGMVNDETLDCIERAEMAISVTGGSPRDEFELVLLRAHWDVLAGLPSSAISRLESLYQTESAMPPVVMAEFWYLRALAASEIEDNKGTVEYAAKAVDLFQKTGAEARLRKSRELLDKAEKAHP